MSERKKTSTLGSDSKSKPKSNSKSAIQALTAALLARERDGFCAECKVGNDKPIVLLYNIKKSRLNPKWVTKEQRVVPGKCAGGVCFVCHPERETRARARTQVLPAPAPVSAPAVPMTTKTSSAAATPARATATATIATTTTTTTTKINPTITNTHGRTQLKGKFLLQFATKALERASELGIDTPRLQDIVVRDPNNHERVIDVDMPWLALLPEWEDPFLQQLSSSYLATKAFREEERSTATRPTHAPAKAKGNSLSPTTSRSKLNKGKFLVQFATKAIERASEIEIDTPQLKDVLVKDKNGRVVDVHMPWLAQLPEWEDPYFEQLRASYMATKDFVPVESTTTNTSNVADTSGGDNHSSHPEEQHQQSSLLATQTLLHKGKFLLQFASKSIERATETGLDNIPDLEDVLVRDAKGRVVDVDMPWLIRVPGLNDPWMEQLRTLWMASKALKLASSVGLETLPDLEDLIRRDINGIAFDLEDSWFLRLPASILEGLGFQEDQQRQWKTAFREKKALKKIFRIVGQGQRVEDTLEKLPCFRIIDCWEDYAKYKIVNSRVTHLHLSGSQLIETLPASEMTVLTNLQVLDLSSCKNLKVLPKEVGSLIKLRSIDLHGCESLQSLPSQICNLKDLQYINASWCTSLSTFPSAITNLPLLRTFFLEGCPSLLSIPALPKTIMVAFDVERESIQKISNAMAGNLMGLKTTNRIQRNSDGKVTALYLDKRQHLVHLPADIGNFVHLETISCSFCESLETLAPEMGDLISLQNLNLSFCRALEWLPAEMGKLIHLKNLMLAHCTALKSIPLEVGKLSSLQKIDLRGCKALETSPLDLPSLPDVKDVYLYQCESSSSLPFSIDGLPNLRMFMLDEDSSLRSRPSLPTNLTTSIRQKTKAIKTQLEFEYQTLEKIAKMSGYNIDELEKWYIARNGDGRLTQINLRRCRLTSLPPEIRCLGMLQEIHLRHCPSLISLPSEIGTLTQLKELDLSFCPALASLPALGNLVNLTMLNVEQCSSLAYLPAGIGRLARLQVLALSGCKSLESLPGIGGLVNLPKLDLSNCETLQLLPFEIGNLQELSSLKLSGCRSLKFLPSTVGSLSHLQELRLEGCTSLASLPPEIGGLPKLSALSVDGCENLPKPLRVADDPLAFMRDMLLLRDEPPAALSKIKMNNGLLFTAAQYPEYAAGFAWAWQQDSSLANQRDNLGRNALDLACTECKHALLFLGRYQIDAQLKYKSRTCEVYFALDLAACANGRPVAIKFMFSKQHFNAERNARRKSNREKRFSGKFVIEDLEYFDGDANFAFRNAATSRGLAKYCIVLEQGERNLHEAVWAEDVCRDINQVRSILEKLARCLAHLHIEKFVHGDFKPRNCIRQAVDRGWRLIDLDGAVSIGSPMRLKLSTAYIPPEMLTIVDEEPCLLACFNNFVDDDEVVKAHPSFDVWSFGVVMFFLITGKQFFDGVDNYDSLDEEGLRRLAEWSDRMTESRLEKNVKHPSALNLLRKILKCDPGSRLNISEVLSDLFFQKDVEICRDRLFLFQSDPLAVYLNGVFRPVDRLHFQEETDMLSRALDDAKVWGGNIDVISGAASIERLSSFFDTRLGDVMHLSGHCHDEYFLLETSCGEGQLLRTKDVKEYLLDHLKLVFLMGCRSENIGHALVEAKVQHVVCIRRGQEVNHMAAAMFASSFYRALASGRSLIHAFRRAQDSVRKSSQIGNPFAEAGKFLLLPESIDTNDYHDVRIFFNGGSPPTSELPAIIANFGFQCDTLPRVPAHFIGHELAMHSLIKGLLRSNVVEIVGPSAVGNTRIVSAVCHYIAQRSRSFPVTVDSFLWLPAPIQSTPIDDVEFADWHNQVSSLLRRNDCSFDNIKTSASELFAGKNIFVVFDSARGSAEEGRRFSSIFINILLIDPLVNMKVILIKGASVGVDTGSHEKVVCDVGSIAPDC